MSTIIAAVSDPKKHWWNRRGVLELLTLLTFLVLPLVIHLATT